MVEPSKQKLRSIFSKLEKEHTSNLRNKTKMKQKNPNKISDKVTTLSDILWRWWIIFVVWLTDERRLALFPAGNVRDLHHRESPTHREQHLNLRKTLSLGFVEWSCAVVITTSDNSAIVRKLFQAPLQITYWLTLQKRGQKPYIDRKLIWKLGGLKIIILLTLQCFILKI